MSWPPTLAELKTDMGRDLADTSQDEALGQVLDAAVVFVQGRRGKDFNFPADPLSTLPAPSADIVLGTLRLAGRWHTRRRSPDALIQMADMGASRVPSFDADIEQLLGIGRYRRSVIA